MKQHRALRVSLSLCGWLTFPLMTLGYVLGWPSIVQTLLATPLLIVVLWAEIVDHRRWRDRFGRVRAKLR